MLLTYKTVRLDFGYCIDLPVGDSLIVELNAMEGSDPVHSVQRLSFLFVFLRVLCVLCGEKQ